MGGSCTRGCGFHSGGRLSGRIAAENTEFVGAIAEFGESLADRFVRGRAPNVEVEAVMPGAAFERAAFNFEQVNTTFREYAKC